MININKISIKLKRELGRNINIDVLEGALRRRGYHLLFTNSSDGQEQLRNLDLLEYAIGKKAFTICSAIRIVFVDGEQHEKDLIKLLLHELAHIVLGHMGNNELSVHDDISQEIEANAVVYKVLNCDYPFALRVAFLVSVMLLALSLVANTYMYQKVSAPAVLIMEYREPITQTSVPITEEAEPIADENASATNSVYVTPSGNKYHKIDCQYVNIKRALALERSDAEANYAPCRVCNP